MHSNLSFDGKVIFALGPFSSVSNKFLLLKYPEYI
jgi:hypothetical protein